MTADDAARLDRRRRRQELLERRAMTLDWRRRLLARRIKAVQGRRDLARRLVSLNTVAPGYRQN